LDPNAKANTRRACQRSVEGEDNLSRNAGFVAARVDAPSARRRCIARKNLGKERVDVRAAGRIISLDALQRLRDPAGCLDFYPVQLEVSVHIASGPSLRQ